MQYDPSDSRSYRHRTCGAKMTVSGKQFRKLADVYAHPDRAYCKRCDGEFAVYEFCWDDTDEKLTDFYSRYAAVAPGLKNFLLSGDFRGVLTYLALLTGGLLGFLIGRKLQGVGAGILLAILGALIEGGIAYLVGTAVKARAWSKIFGVADSRELE